MRVEGGTSNIINGISRQPSEIRLTSQLEESINQFPTLTKGLIPRNPTRWLGKLPKARTAAALTHIINRDANERYIATIDRPTISVHDLNGNPQQVNEQGNAYLYLLPPIEGAYEALTVADHTFVLNKNYKVISSSALTPYFAPGGLVHVVKGEYTSHYGVTIRAGANATANTVALYTTPDSYASDNNSANARQRATKPSSIATILLTGQTPFGYNANNLNANLSSTDWVKDQYDNVIHIYHKNTNNNFHLHVSGDEENIRAHKGTAPALDRLPRKAPPNFGIKITGSQESQYDDYYVKFDHPYGVSEGSWKETVAPIIRYKLLASSMPHLLVREADGSFTFKPAEWAGREVGDLETNPWPSFVESRIKGMTFFKNRLCLFSGESVALSRHDDHFNFFIESVITPLDTDPIDVTIAYPDVSDIYHAVPFGSELMLFTTSATFRVATSGELLTPKTVAIEPVLDLKASQKVKPIVGNDKCYFVSDRESGSFVHEFLFDEASGVRQAPSLTDHVQGYIPSDIKLMEVDDDLKLLALVSSKEPTHIYYYKWFWVGQEKVQAAWGRWVIDNPIITMKFSDEELIIVTDAGDEGREILSLNCHEAWDRGLPFEPLLDKSLMLDASAPRTYNAALDVTIFTLPYKAEGVHALNASTDNFGLELKASAHSTYELAIEGNHTGAVLVGIPFDSYCVLSKFHHRSTDNHGSFGNAISGSNLTVANLILETGTCAYLTVTLSRDYRPDFTYEFSAAQVGTKTGKLGVVVFGKIEKTVSIMSRNSDFSIKIGSNTPYPYSLLSYRWTGDAKDVAY